MGNWNICIQGVGVHHNHPSLEYDADVMAKRFVAEMMAKGHSITSATIVAGGSTELRPVDGYPVQPPDDTIPGGAQ